MEMSSPWHSVAREGAAPEHHETEKETIQQPERPAPLCQVAQAEAQTTRQQMHFTEQQLRDSFLKTKIETEFKE